MPAAPKMAGMFLSWEGLIGKLQNCPEPFYNTGRSEF